MEGMRKAYRFVLVMAGVLAAMAMVASSASALSAVEVEDAIAGGHCGEVELTPTGHEATGGCELHVVNMGLINLINHSSPTVETVVTQCNMEFNVNIDENGEGYVTHQSITPGTSFCGTAWRPCLESDPHIGGTGAEPVPWHLQIEETGVSSDHAEHAVIEVCLIVVVPPGINCTVEKEVEVHLIRKAGAGYTAEIEGDLEDHFNPCNLDSEFEGHYEFEHLTEHYTEIEIHHDV